MTKRKAKSCLECGAQIVISGPLGGARKFCSPECYNASKNRVEREERARLRAMRKAGAFRKAPPPKAPAPAAGEIAAEAVPAAGSRRSPGCIAGEMEAMRINIDIVVELSVGFVEDDR